MQLEKFQAFTSAQINNEVGCYLNVSFASSQIDLNVDTGNNWTCLITNSYTVHSIGFR